MPLEKSYPSDEPPFDVVLSTLWVAIPEFVRTARSTCFDVRDIDWFSSTDAAWQLSNLL